MLLIRRPLYAATISLLMLQFGCSKAHSSTPAPATHQTAPSGANPTVAAAKPAQIGTIAANNASTAAPAPSGSDSSIVVSTTPAIGDSPAFASSIAPVKTMTSYGPNNALISTQTYTYSKNGNTQIQLTATTYASGSTSTRRSETAFNTAGNETSYRSFPSAAATTATFEIDYVYDGSGNILTQTTYDTGTVTSVDSFTYSGSVAITHTQTDGSGKTLVSDSIDIAALTRHATTSTYNSAALATQTVVDETYQSANDMSIYGTFFFVTQSTIVTSTAADPNNTTPSKTEITCADDGVSLHTCTGTETFTGMANSELYDITINYTSSGSFKTETASTFVTSDMSATDTLVSKDTVTTKFNAQGNSTALTDVNVDGSGNVTDKSSQTTTYDAGGYDTVESDAYDKNGNLTHKDTYTY